MQPQPRHAEIGISPNSCRIRIIIWLLGALKSQQVDAENLTEIFSQLFLSYNAYKNTDKCVQSHNSVRQVPRAGSGVARIDPLRDSVSGLAGCRKR